MGRVKQDTWFSNVVTKAYLYDAAGQFTITGGWEQQGVTSLHSRLWLTRRRGYA
jgi:hypothetical protein